MFSVRTMEKKANTKLKKKKLHLRLPKSYTTVPSYVLSLSHILTVERNQKKRERNQKILKKKKKEKRQKRGGGATTIFSVNGER